MSSPAEVMSLQWPLTLLIAGGSAIVASVRWQDDWAKGLNVQPRPGYPSDAEFRAGIRRLSSASDAASSFADRAKALNVAYLDSMKALDDKASVILGFVGGGSSLIALAAGTDKIARPAVTPLLVLGALYLFGVLVFAIAVQLPRNRGSVDVEALCDVELLRAYSGKSQMDAIMGREYVEASRKAVLVVRIKALFLTAAQICFAFAVATIVTNALVRIPADDSQKAGAEVHCTGGATSIDCSLKRP